MRKSLVGFALVALVGARAAPAAAQGIVTDARRIGMGGLILQPSGLRRYNAAYRAVREPVEGTMLTAIRGLAEAAERETGLPPGELLQLLVERGEAIVADTPKQLEALREAGVVDAGAAGLVELLRGVAAAVAGHELPPGQPIEATAAEGVHQELSRFRYCTTFVIEGENLDTAEIERELERLGDSLLVVGDASALKAHVHTDEPGAAPSVI